MSLRQFQGWTPTTRYAYDDTGRMVGAAPASEWDDEQRGWMLALARLEADTCKGCGGVLSETTELDRWGRQVHKYEAPPPVKCYSCIAIGEQQEKHKDAKHPHALMFTVAEKT